MNDSEFENLNTDQKLQLAIHIHRNHDQVIAALKEDQWKYFSWSSAILGAIALGDAASKGTNWIELLAVVAFVAALGVVAILRAQMGLVSRISELAYLQSKIGPEYMAFRRKSAAKKAHLFFRAEVWGFQTIVLVLLAVLITTR